MLRIHFFAVAILIVACTLAPAAETNLAGYALDITGWRNQDLPKNQHQSNHNLDLDADNMLGTAGYVLFTPNAGGDTRMPAPKLASELPMAQLPEWITVRIVPDNAEVVSYGSYAIVDAPRPGDPDVRTGALVATPETADAPSPLLEITFGEGAPGHVRLGLMLDNLNNPAYNTGFWLVRPDGKTADPIMTTAKAGNANNVPDWYFFDVQQIELGATVLVEAQPAGSIISLGILTIDISPVDSASYYAQFEHPGRYVKDYYVFKDNETWHLFYNIGLADGLQTWDQPGNENMFGHATSRDLQEWKYHPGVIIAQPLTWEEGTVSAPSIIKRGGKYWMAYTGFDRHVTQQIGMAYSDDLFKWTRFDQNPVYHGAEWTNWQAGRWADCRDADIVEWKDRVLMFNTVTSDKGEGMLAVARSTDMVNWEDLGRDAAINAGFHPPESPRAFVHKDKMYVFASSGTGHKLWVSEDPESGRWRELPFRFPTGGLWSGWEVVEGPEGQTLFSAFLWKTHGNFIRFWEVEWDGEVPVLKQ